MTRRPQLAIAFGAAMTVALAVAVLAPAPAPAQSAIKVVVNDRAITSFDIQQRARLISLTSRVANPTQLATEELIDDALKLGEAKRMKITVSDAEVNEAFAAIAERIKMTPDGLAKALSGSGVQPATLKSRLRAQIAWGKLVRQQFQREVSVSEQDVVRALRAKQSGDAAKVENKTVEYSLARVIFVVPKGASPGAIAQRQHEAEALRGRFNGCDAGLAFAKSLSEVVTQPPVLRLGSDLNPELVTILEATGVGKLTPPERSTSGLELVAICSKREIASDYDVRQGMQQEMRTEEGEIMSRRYLRDVRANAVIEYK